MMPWSMHHVVPVQRQQRVRRRGLQLRSNVQKVVAVAGTGVLVVADGQHHPPVERSGRIVAQREAPEVHSLVDPGAVGAGSVGEQVGVGGAETCNRWVRRCSGTTPRLSPSPAHRKAGSVQIPRRSGLGWARGLPESARCRLRECRITAHYQGAGGLGVASFSSDAFPGSVAVGSAAGVGGSGSRLRYASRGLTGVVSVVGVVRAPGLGDHDPENKGNNHNSEHREAAARADAAHACADPLPASAGDGSQSAPNALCELARPFPAPTSSRAEDTKQLHCQLRAAIQTADK